MALSSEYGKKNANLGGVLLKWGAGPMSSTFDLHVQLFVPVHTAVHITGAGGGVISNTWGWGGDHNLTTNLIMTVQFHAFSRTFGAFSRAFEPNLMYLTAASIRCDKLAWRLERPAHRQRRPDVDARHSVRTPPRDHVQHRRSETTDAPAVTNREPVLESGRERHPGLRRARDGHASSPTRSPHNVIYRAASERLRVITLQKGLVRYHLLRHRLVLLVLRADRRDLEDDGRQQQRQCVRRVEQRGGVSQLRPELAPCSLLRAPCSELRAPSSELRAASSDPCSLPLAPCYNSLARSSRTAGRVSSHAFFTRFTVTQAKGTPIVQGEHPLMGTKGGRFMADLEM